MVWDFKPSCDDTIVIGGGIVFGRILNLDVFPCVETYSRKRYIRKEE
jgi:hypothetical protein